MILGSIAFGDQENSREFYDKLMSKFGVEVLHPVLACECNPHIHEKSSCSRSLLCTCVNGVDYTVAWTTGLVKWLIQVDIYHGTKNGVFEVDVHKLVAHDVAFGQ